MSTYTVDPETGCWVWTGAKGAGGYGRVAGRAAHRMMYELMVGPIPPRCHVHHICRNVLCVNPDHLEVLTSAEHASLHRASGAPRTAPKGSFSYLGANLMRELDYYNESHPAAKMTQTQLAGLIGATPSQVCHHMSGDNAPTPRLLMAYAAAFGCSLDDLFRQEQS